MHKFEAQREEEAEMSKKNGGPTTERGKEVARWNATLHGRGRRRRPEPGR